MSPRGGHALPRLPGWQTPRPPCRLGGDEPVDRPRPLPPVPAHGGGELPPARPRGGEGLGDVPVRGLRALRAGREAVLAVSEAALGEPPRRPGDRRAVLSHRGPAIPRSVRA